MIEDAGHAAFEPGIARALVAATERFKANQLGSEHVASRVV